MRGGGISRLPSLQEYILGDILKKRLSSKREDGQWKENGEKQVRILELIAKERTSNVIQIGRMAD